MKWKDNKVGSIIDTFNIDLKDLYEEEEIKNFLFMLFEDLKAWTKADVILSKNERLSESEILYFHFAAKRLQKFEPIQYIIGKAYFDDMMLHVNQKTLIPRQETEELVVLMEQYIKANNLENSKIIDIGTGSGAIALALKKRIPSLKVDALDFDEETLNVATKNAKEQKLEVNFFLKNILEDDINDLDNYDIVVSNPPYVKENEKNLMKANVLEYEPHSALFVANNDPFVFYNKIVSKFSKKGTSVFFFEINEFLGEEMVELFKNNFSKVELIQDLQNKNRFLHLKK